MKTTLAFLFITAALNASADFSWQQPHAKVLPRGELEWQTEPYRFIQGDSVRYIDYEDGDDHADGTSKRSAWKHHPWDANAEGLAAACSGIHTYVFKRGVIYRGALVAKESGRPGNPIRLTGDPSWGNGEAMLFGSSRINGGWKRCAKADVPKYMPEPEKVWMRDIDLEPYPFALWELRGDDIIRLKIARHPNWTVSNMDDPQAEWFEWTHWEKGVGARDEAHLKGKPDDFFDGGHVWTEWSGNMGTINIRRITGYDPKDGAIKGHNGRRGNRYYIEHVPGYLDEPGEYYIDANGRMFLRLPDNRDPNRTVLEASRRTHLIDIVDHSHIVVSGLRFSFNNATDIDTDWPPAAKYPTCIRVAGNCADIEVSHCRFLHVLSVFNAFPRMIEKYTDIYLKDLRPWTLDVVDDIRFNDNDIAYVDRPAVTFRNGRMLTRVEGTPYGKLKKIEVLRNRFYYTSHRPGGNIYSAIPTLGVYFPEEAEIAGNMVKQCWGSGIFVFGGKASGETGEVPLTRILIHHNRIENAMLACNDYGGLEYWQGGPIYAYNNISANSIGYKHYVPLDNDWKTVAYNVYLDGTFKSYTFNNIIWGKSGSVDYPYRNRGGYFVVLGFMDHLFNNTIYTFRRGIAGSSGNRCAFLANVVAGVTGSFIQQNREGDTSLRGGGDTGAMGARGMPSNAYGYNVFVGDEPVGNARMVKGDSVEEWRDKLEEIGAQLSHTGWKVEKPQMRDPDNRDFRLRGDSQAVDNGVKFFVPWALYGTVGEWHFMANPGNPEIVLGENFYMADYWYERHMYDLVPRYNLKAPGATREHFVEGPLEDWSTGAMVFDGKARFCILPDDELKKDFTVHYTVKEESMAPGETMFPADAMKTVDIDRENLLVEVYFRTEKGPGAGNLVAKAMPDSGYRMPVQKNGTIAFAVISEGKEQSASSRAKVNDGQWHHVIGELDREAQVIRLYVDGKLDTERKISINGSLSNTGDFLVGKGFSGAIDFLRVARGTLADADTTIEELYAWQFDGPFLRDWNGVKPVGRRDAGAIEFQ